MNSDVEDLLSAGEGPSVEFKTSLSDSRKIIETLAAMATLGGGTVLIGVRDDGTVAGAKIGEGEHERLVQQILTATDPRLYVELDEPIVQGKRLLRIRVPPGDGPHLAFGRAFHRVGRATVAMTRDEYERRLLDRLRESSGFERRWVEGATSDEVSQSAVGRWVELARERVNGLSPKQPPGEVLARLHLTHGARINVAGWLLFGNDPQRPFPQAVIRARAERGASKDSQVITGTLAEQIDSGVAFVARNLRIAPIIKGVRREERSEVPLVAVRELIANAVAHRDYRSTAASQLRVTDAGVELWNPGHFPPPITPAMLREQHPSVPPNPLIARALYLAGYVEEWGTGTLRMIESLRENGNPSPTFTAEAEQGVKVTLPLAGAPVSSDERAGRVLNRFSVGKPFTSRAFAEKARIAVRTAGLDLKRLEQEGLVRRVGVGRATRWVRS